MIHRIVEASMVLDGLCLLDLDKVESEEHDDDADNYPSEYDEGEHRDAQTTR